MGCAGRGGSRGPGATAERLSVVVDVTRGRGGLRCVLGQNQLELANGMSYERKTDVRDSPLGGAEGWGWGASLNRETLGREQGRGKSKALLWTF